MDIWWTRGYSGDISAVYSRGNGTACSILGRGTLSEEDIRRVSGTRHLCKHLATIRGEIICNRSAEVNTIALKLTFVEGCLLCIGLALLQGCLGIFLRIQTHHHVIEHQEFGISLRVATVISTVTTGRHDYRTTSDTGVALMVIGLAIRIRTCDIVDIGTTRLRASGSWGVLRNVGGGCRV